MAHNNHSSQSDGSTNGNFIALVLVVSFVSVVALFALSTLRQADPEPVATLVGRNLNYRPSPTNTATPTATFTPTATPTATRTPWPSSTPSLTPTPTVTPLGADVAAMRASQGERVFQSVCSACHGFNAQGVSGLGPSMIGNTFINSLSNDDLHDFINVGRPASDPSNKSGVTMPARGGNPSLTDDDLMNVIFYVRSLNPGVVIADSGGGTSVEAAATSVPEVREPVEAIEFNPLSLSGILGDRDDNQPSDVNLDAFLEGAASDYAFSCAGCHGVDGAGNVMTPALGDNDLLAAGNGIGMLELFTHAIPGGFMHPHRGGYPELTDEELLALIGYLYSLPVIKE